MRASHGTYSFSSSRGSSPTHFSNALPVQAQHVELDGELLELVTTLRNTAERRAAVNAVLDENFAEAEAIKDLQADVKDMQRQLNETAEMSQQRRAMLEDNYNQTVAELEAAQQQARELALVGAC